MYIRNEGESMEHMYKWGSVLMFVIIAGISVAAIYLSHSVVVWEVTDVGVPVVNPLRAVLATIFVVVAGIIIFLERNRLHREA